MSESFDYYWFTLEMESGNFGFVWDIASSGIDALGCLALKCFFAMIIQATIRNKKILLKN